MKLLLVALLLLVGCEKKETPKEVIDLIARYQKAQEEMGTYDAALKKAGTDEGAQIQINYDKALAQSRLERLKEQLKRLSPESVVETQAAGAGHGGGH